MMWQAPSGQIELFYDIRLEDYVPRGRLLRGVDRHLDLSALREHPKPFYSAGSRPGADGADVAH